MIVSFFTQHKFRIRKNTTIAVSDKPSNRAYSSVYSYKVRVLIIQHKNISKIVDIKGKPLDIFHGITKNL